VPSAPFVAGSQTSAAAADAALPRTGTQRRAVYDAIAAAGIHGLTDEECQDRLRMNPSTQRPRRVELVERRLIMPLSKRPVRSGLRAVVWVTVEVFARTRAGAQLRLELGGVR
jgi:hypothetical protein